MTLTWVKIDLTVLKIATVRGNRNQNETRNQIPKIGDAETIRAVLLLVRTSWCILKIHRLIVMQVHTRKELLDVCVISLIVTSCVVGVATTSGLWLSSARVSARCTGVAMLIVNSVLATRKCSYANELVMSCTFTRVGIHISAMTNVFTEHDHFGFAIHTI